MRLAKTLSRLFRNISVITIMWFCFTSQLPAQPLSGIYTVGGPASPDFPDITTAFSSISSYGLNGAIILELQAGYNSAGEVFPLNFPAIASPDYTITVRPAVSGLSVLNTTAQATFTFNNASNCIIDGRINGLGSLPGLIVENSNVSGRAIQFLGDAVDNIIRYCLVKGAGTSSVSGVITFGSGLSVGCSNNLIEYCEVTGSSTYPRNCIYSQGSSSALNSGNIIRNCNIYNFYNPGGDVCGVCLDDYNYNWLIEGNSFYQTETRNITGGFFPVQSSSGTSDHLRIRLNYIGGSGQGCSGNPLSLTGSGVFRGIRLTVGDDVTSVQGNTIQNINLVSSSGSNAFSCIHLVSGFIYCGDTLPNIIGSMADTNSIVFMLSSTGAVFSGILAGLGDDPGEFRIMNNLIGGLTATGSGTVNFRGIFIQSDADAYMVTGNTIGSPYAPLINTTNKSSFGIYSTSPTPDQLISGNVIQNLINSSETTGSQLVGISTPGSSGGSFKIRNNVVRNLSTACTTGSLTTNSALIGIMLNATTYTEVDNVVENNTISGLYCSAPSQNSNLIGILYSGPDSGNNVINNNFIHSLSSASTAATSCHYGIYFLNGNSIGQLKIYNNMIRLGIDSTGNSISLNPVITGIYKSSSGNISVSFNSIYIGGSNVGTQYANTYAFRRSSGSPPSDSLYSNILYNARSNASTGGNHYAYVWNNTAGVSCDYNVIYAPGTGGSLVSFDNGSTALNTISEIQSALAYNNLATQIADPLFVLPEGNSSSLNLHCQNMSPAEGVGFPVPYVDYDFDGETRSSLSPVDVGADAGDYGIIYMAGSYTVGEGGDYQNLTGISGFFNAINHAIITGNITANIISDLTEPGIIDLSEWTESGLGEYSLTVQPNTDILRSIVNNHELNLPMIRIRQVSRITFNGGTGKYLLFRNSSPTAENTRPVFSFNNGVTNTSLINCKIQSNASEQLNAVVVAGSTGANYITISNCEISNSPEGSPATAIYSNNSQNVLTLQNNQIYNWSRYGLWLRNVANNLDISGNHFYYNLPSPATGDQTAIFVGSGGNHSIINNTIGGNSSTYEGIWSINGISTFIGIDLALSGTNLTVVDGNIITKISLTDTGSTVFKGIHLSSGFAYIGYINGNKIGGANSTNIIKINGNGRYYGIHEETTNTNTSIEKNVIGYFMLDGNTGSPKFYGIHFNVSDIKRNRILAINSFDSAFPTVIHGIYNNCSENISLGISNNMVSLNSGNASNPVVYCYYDNAVQGAYVFLYHNSFYIYGNLATSSNTYTLYRNGSSDIKVFNNILVNNCIAGSGSKHYSVFTALNTNWDSDFNDLFSLSSPLVYWGGAEYTNLNDFQLASSEDTSSVSGLPIFLSNNDLHLVTSANCFLNEKALANTGVTTDFDNEARGNFPDIGADEFSPGLPSTPVSAGNKSVCYGLPVPELGATGVGIMRWYSDPNLTNLVHTGSPYYPPVTEPGVYTFYVTNGVLSCESAAVTISLTIFEPPVAVASVVDTTLCTGIDIQLNGTASGGSGPAYSFVWSGPSGFNSNIQNPVLLNAQLVNAGQYSLTVTDGNSCSSVVPGNISVYIFSPPAVYAGPDKTIPNGANTTLTATGSGGSGNFAYQWYPLAYISGTGNTQSIQTVNLSVTQVFYVEMTDLTSNCPIQADQLTVNVTGVPLSVTASANYSQICQGNSTQLIASALGGTGSYSFSWYSSPEGFFSNSQNPDVSPSVTTTYFVTVTDSYNTVQSSVTITVFSLPFATASVLQSTLCSESTLQLYGNASGGSGTGFIYNWTGPDSWYSDFQNPSIINIQTANAGTYYLNVTDDRGCQSSGFSSVELFVNPTPGASASANPAVICSGDTIFLAGAGSGGSGSYTYNWSGPASFSSVEQNPLIMHTQPAQSGNYQLVVHDLNGCLSINTAFVMVTVNAIPVANAVAGDESICSGQNIQLNGSASGGFGSAYTYHWTGPAGYNSSAQFPVVTNAQPANSGIYELIVNDANACSSAPYTVLVTVFETPVANAGSSITIPNGAYANLSGSATGGSGNYSYAWTPVSLINGSSFQQNVQTMNLSVTQAFHLVVGDLTTLCTSNPDQVTVIVTGLPLVVYADIAQSEICQGGSDTLTALVFGGSGTYSYSWTSEPPGFTSSLPNPVINPEISSTYNVVVNDGYNNVTSTVNVIVHENPVAAAISPDTSLCAGSTLFLAGNASGGSGYGYNYEWKGPGAFNSSLQNPVLFNIQPDYSGAFTLEVTDIQGCHSEPSFVNVQIHSIPMATAGTADPTVCAGSEILLTGFATNGSGSAYNYQWTGPGSFTSDQQNPVIPDAQLVNQGDYNLAVTDSEGCSSVLSFVSVSIVPLPVASAGSDQNILNGAYTNLLGNASGGSGNYGYSWTPSSFISGNALKQLVQTISLSSSVEYSLVVTDSLTSCVSAADNVIINVSGLPLSLSINANTGTICEGAAALLDAVISGGSGTYNCSWSSNPPGFTSNAQNISVSPSITTMYILVINDGYNSVSENITIHVNSNTPVSLAPFADICINAPVFNLTGGSPSGGTYSGPGVSNGTFSAINAGQGTHTISYQYIDINGCVNNASANITVYDLPPVSFNNSLYSQCVNSPVILLSGGTPSGGSYSGPGVNGNQFNPALSGPGTFNIVYAYSDASGCSDQAANSITVHSLPDVQFNSVLTPVCLNDPQVLLYGGIPSGGTYSGAAVAGGYFNPVSAGTGSHEIIYRYVDSTNCENSDTNFLLVNIIPLSFGISGNGSYCPGEQGLTVFLNGSQTGISYQLLKDANPYGPAKPGTGNSLSWQSLEAAQYTIIASDDDTGCSSFMTGTVTITTHTLPMVFNLTGSGSYCHGFNGKTITLSGSENGILYQLMKNGIPEGTAVTGNGSTISWNNMTAGSYDVVATNPCARNMDGTVVITEDPAISAVITSDPVYVIEGQDVQLFTSYSGGSGTWQSFLWSGPGSGYISGTTIPEPLFNSPNVGNYPVNFEVTDDHGCKAFDDLMIHVTSAVQEPFMNGQAICGTGNVLMTAIIGYGGDEIQFSLDGINPVLTDTNAPYEYMTPVIVAGNDLVIYARAHNTANGLFSTWVTATASALTASEPGYIEGGGNVECQGGSTGPLKLVGYHGSIIRWQKRINSGAWQNIAFTGDTYEEIQNVPGNWEYRAVVQLSVCSEDFSDPVMVKFSANTVAGNLTVPVPSICSGSSTGVLSVSDYTGTILQWERKYNNGPWVIVDYNTSTFSESLTLSGIWHYRVLVQNDGCNSEYTNTLNIIVHTVPNGGNLSGGGQVCFGSYIPVMVLSAYTGQILKWQKRYNNGSWEDIVNIGTWFTEIPPTSGQWSYRTVIEGYVCNDVYSNVVDVQVLPQSLGGTVNGSNSICLGSTTGYMTLTNYNGTILKWQKRYENGPWTDLNHFSAIYHEIPASPGTWHYRAVILNGVCGFAYSSKASILVSSPAVGGSVTGGSEICTGSQTGILTLTGFSGSVVKWQRSFNEGAWTDINNQLSTYGELLIQPGSYKYRALIDNGGCSQVYSQSTNVVVTQQTLAGEVIGGNAICFGEQCNMLSLSAYSGLIICWQKRLNGGAWNNIQNTLDYYQEIPASEGAWDYRAVVKNGNCNAAYSSFTTVTVNALPIVQIISGNPLMCAGTSGSTLVLSSSQAGVGYQLVKDGQNLGFPIQGTGLQLQWINLQTGLYTVYAVNTQSFCVSQMQGILEISEVPIPLSFQVSSAGFDCGGLGTGSIHLSGSENGISYSLIKDGIIQDMPLIGTGLELEWPMLAVGSYQIMAANQLNSCQSLMTGTGIIGPAPLPQQFQVTGGGIACQNTTGAPIGLDDSEAGILYELFVDGYTSGITMEGTNQALDFGIQQLGGEYTIIGTSIITGCNIQMTGNAQLTILPAPAVELGPDINMIYGSSVVMNPSIGQGLGPYTYLWAPSTALSNSTVVNPVANPLDSITYTLYVTGANTCVSVDEIAIIPTLPDGQSVVSGLVTYGNVPLTPLHGIPVFLKSQSGFVISQTNTDSDGHFMFQPFPDGQYILTAGSEQAVGGYNSTDALRILKHFVHTQPLSGIWLKAGDVDNSSYINSIDALGVQLRFVGALSAFTAGKWVFEKKAVSYNGGIFNDNLLGLCYGDVNGSYIPYAKNESILPVKPYGSITAGSNQEVMIPVYVSKSVDIGAISLSFTYNEAEIEIISAELSKSNDNLVMNQADGMFSISYVSENTFFYSTENPLLFIRAIIRGNNPTISVTGEFADQFSDVINDITLLIPETKLLKINKSGSLYYYPNPADCYTTFEINLEEIADVSILIVDISGRIICSWEKLSCQPGIITHTFDLKQYPSGIYFGRCRIGKDLINNFKLEVIH